MSAAGSDALHWQVVGDVFGRELLLAAFLTQSDAEDYAKWRKRTGSPVRVVIPPEASAS